MTDKIVLSNDESRISHRLTGDFVITNNSLHLTPTAPPSRFSSELYFNVKIDPFRQNYISLKLFSADEYTPLFLYVDSKQIGYAKCSDFEAINLCYGSFASSGYFFVTSAIPLSYTKGKSEITLSLRHGDPYNDLDNIKGGISEIYSSISPSIPLCETPVAINIAQCEPVTRAHTLSKLYIEKQVEFFNTSLQKLRHGEKLSITKYVEEFRHFIMTLFEPYCPLSDKTEAVKLILDCINSYVQDYFENPESLLRTSHQSDWGGYYGELGQGLYLIEALLDKPRFFEYLQTPFNSTLTKKEAWETCLKANFDFASARQSYIYNQTYYTYEGAWKSMAGLGVIESRYYIGKEKCDLILKESLGLAPWKGEHILTDENGRELDLYHCLFNHDRQAHFTDDFKNIVCYGKAVQKLDENGNFVRRKPYGEHYYPLTHRYLPRENGYVGNYGETANYLPEWVYRTFVHTDYELSDLILKAALENINSRMYMRYQSYDSSSNPIMLMEQAIDERNPTMNAKSAYGAIIHDKRTYLFASLKRHMDENAQRYSSAEWDKYKIYAKKAIDALYEQYTDNHLFCNFDEVLSNYNDFKIDRTICDIFAEKHEYVLPHSDKNNKDFVFFDIDNLLLSLKDGDTHIFAQLNHRNRGYSAFGRAHIIRKNTHHLTQFATDGFFVCGGRYIRQQNVNMDFISDSQGSNSFFRPPSSIEEFAATAQALTGEEIPVTYQKGVGKVLRENFEVDTPYTGYPDFIWAKIEDYLVICNTTRVSYQNKRDFTLPFKVNSQSVTLPPFSYKIIKTKEPILFPSSVKIVDALTSSKGILLSWKCSEGEKYNIYRNGEFLASAIDTSFLDTSVLPDKKYTYYITSVNSFGESHPSPSVTAVSAKTDGLLKFKIGNPVNTSAIFGEGNDYKASERQINDSLIFYADSVSGDFSALSPHSVMARESLSPDTRYAYIGFENDKIVIRTRSKNTMYSFTAPKLSPLCYTFDKGDYTHVKLLVDSSLHSVAFYGVKCGKPTLLLREVLPLPASYYIGSLSSDVSFAEETLNEPFPIKSVTFTGNSLHVDKGLDNKYLMIESSLDGENFIFEKGDLISQTYKLDTIKPFYRITAINRLGVHGKPIIVNTVQNEKEILK